VVVLDCSAVSILEYTALQQLITFEERLRQAGVELWLAQLNPRALRAVERSALGATLGRGKMFFNLEAAVHQYMQYKL
jgi:anti-anti-sigma regulatory factor